MRQKAETVVFAADSAMADLFEAEAPLAEFEMNPRKGTASLADFPKAS